MKANTANRKVAFKKLSAKYRELQTEVFIALVELRVSMYRNPGASHTIEQTSVRERLNSYRRARAAYWRACGTQWEAP